MNKRNCVRYECGFFPVNMSEATLSWEGHASIASTVVNYSAHGIRVSIPALPTPAGLPKKKDVVRVRLAIDRTWFAGMCVFAANEPDGSVSAGIYFYQPEEQNRLNDLLFRSLEAPSPEDSFLSYELEELVAQLCNSADPELRKIGEEKLNWLVRNRRLVNGPAATSSSV